MITKFFPKSDYGIEVCKHRFDADITITEQTDTIEPLPRYTIEYYGFKRNIRSGAFIGKHYPNDSLDVNTINMMGNIRLDVYLNVSAVSDNYTNAMAIIKPWFYNLTNRMPSSVSFAGGFEGLATNTINDFLTGRNSKTGESQYGVFNSEYLGLPSEEFTRENYSNLNSTTRWFDDALSWVDVSNILTDVCNSGGWFRNFTHWHWLKRDNVVYKQDDFYQTINNTLLSLGKRGHFCSFGEASEYLTFRQLIKKAACYKSSNGKLRIALEVDDLYLQDRLNTPISVKINLAGTPFSGKDFSSINCEIIKVSTDNFIVNIPFRIDSFANKIMVVELDETLTPDYRTFVKPTGTATQSGTSLIVTTDKPCYMVLFQKGTDEVEEKYTLKERQMFLKEQYSFSDLDFVNKTYKVGIIDRFQNQNLL